MMTYINFNTESYIIILCDKMYTWDYFRSPSALRDAKSVV